MENGPGQGPVSLSRWPSPLVTTPRWGLGEAAQTMGPCFREPILR